MTLFRITNAALGLLVAIWWLLNRHSDMAEPICAVLAALIVLAEIIGEVAAHRLHAQREEQRAMEDAVLPDLIDRIAREEGNIQQVIDGRRKQDKIIEEYPIELLAPHVPKLKQLTRFYKLAVTLQYELERNNNLPAGSKDFGQLQKLLSEIKRKATLPVSSDLPKWVPRLVSLSLIGVGVCGLFAIRLPHEVKTLDPSPSQKSNDVGESKSMPVKSDPAPEPRATTK